MIFKRFDKQDLFNTKLTDGICLFCGAGFSVLAEDEDKTRLALGDALLNELKHIFPSCEKQRDLSRAAQILDRSLDKQNFKDFLTRRFTVKNYDARYNILASIEIRKIFTTNIDDLLYNVFSVANKNNINNRYINETAVNGESFVENAVNYYALHGCVRMPDKDYVFSKQDIAREYTPVVRVQKWDTFQSTIRNDAVLFWGWNFEDSDVLGAMPNDGSTNRWVLLYEPTEDVIEYVQSMGFHIIISETADMLDYLHEKVNISRSVQALGNTVTLNNTLLKYTIPNKNNVPSIPFEKFFSEYSPEWSFVYSREIPKTTWYSTVENHIATANNVLIYSMRGCGKTTLMMQLLYEYSTPKAKHFVDSILLEDAKVYLNELGEAESVLFMDNCFRDTEALVLLMKAPNVQVVGFDRDYSFERQNFKLNNIQYIPCDITFINESDAINIVEKIPEQLKSRRSISNTRDIRNDMTIVTLLGNVLRPINFGFIRNLADSDRVAAEVLTLICYVHSCGTPVSYDMIFSYLNDGKRSWQEVYVIIDRIGKLVKDADNINYRIDAKQDYYVCRSRSLAESIRDSASWDWDLCADVLLNFVERVPVFKICMFDRFRKSGYDAMRAYRAFWDNHNKTDDGLGEYFYTTCLKSDRSEYIYQQAALYYARIGDYKKAFDWIDKAYNLSKIDRYSIIFTHASIRFDANINISTSDSIVELEQSLDMMNEACEKDYRAHIRIEPYARHVLHFYKIHPHNAKFYLINAKKFIDDILFGDAKDSKISENTRKTLNRHLRNIKNAIDTYVK